MNATHTPGPWSTRDNGEPHAIELIDDEGERIAVLPMSRWVDEHSDPQQEASVALIAAAPGLLAALRAALSALEEASGHVNPELGFADDAEREIGQAIDLARAAIARAEGQS